MKKFFLKNKAADTLLKVLPWVFVILGLIFLLGKKNWWPDFYTPKFFGAVFLVSAILIILPRHLYNGADECRKESVKFFNIILATALTANLAGELYLYRLYLYGFQYDKFLHLVNSFLFTLALVFFLERWRGLTLKKSLFWSVAIVVLGGLVWEGNEYFSDLLFKTSEFGIYGQFKTMDTFFDFSFDVLGAVSAAVFLASPALDNFISKIFTQTCVRPFTEKSKNT